MYFEIDFESPSDALIAPALHNAAGAPSEMNMTTIEDPLGRIRESAYIQWVLTRLKTCRWYKAGARFPRSPTHIGTCSTASPSWHTCRRS